MNDVSLPNVHLCCARCSTKSRIHWGPKDKHKQPGRTTGRKSMWIELFMSRARTTLVLFRPEKSDGFPVFRSAEIFPEHSFKNRSWRRHFRKKRHRGTELQEIGKAHDLFRRSSLHPEQGRRAFFQPPSQDWMSEKSFSLRARMDRIAVCHCARSQACELREDIPHPVTALITRPQLIERGRPRVFLRDDKARQIERIG